MRFAAVVVLWLRTFVFADPLEIPPPEVLAASPAHHYANLTNDEALAELARRHIAFVRVTEGAAGVRLPIRLRGALHGVSVHSSLPQAERDTTPFEILDARLALALDDFCAILSNHDVVELVHFTMYRPSDPHPVETGTGPLRHPGGMAIDVGALRKRSGALMSVAPHWPPSIGAKTCGPGARRLPTRRGRELMSILCEAADSRLFSAMLTPHFNRAHHDHFHLELTPDVKWFMVR
ncbi:MAG TPA: extensin family protein [Polyangiaceae bacterium]|jgi:hypothetical protein|nr:extensin family protein [Polyangiaceae bacterium]